MFEKSGESTTMKVKVNGLAAVEPDSGLDGVAKWVAINPEGLEFFWLNICESWPLFKVKI